MRLLAVAGMAGALAVAFGAFGAHGLDERLTPEALGWWETGTLYLLVHAAAGLAMGLQQAISARPGWFMVFGAGIFAGTLYAMALGAPTVLGAVTPIGGILMIVGWIDVIVSGLRRR
ncbi:MAG: DUF423 domain-containing protein [Pseudomonadota bacterium]